MVKNPPANAGDSGSIPGSGTSPGGGNGNPLQYSCLENPMDRGAWQATQSMGLQRVGYDWAHRQGCKNTLMMSICHLIPVSKPIESVTTSEVNSGGNYGLWMIMCQYGFINCNKCITLVWDIDQRKGYACWATPVFFLPGESQGRGSLVGCRLWGCTESDTTEVT